MFYKSPASRSFNIDSLESKELKDLLRDMQSYIQRIKIEIVHDGRGALSGEVHPAATVGIDAHHPTIRFVDSLNRGQRIEVIAHEIAHLLLIHRYKLRVIGRRMPRDGCHEDVFRFYMTMSGDWVFLLGQIVNTVHHLILEEYLRKEYGIESHLHSHLLQHNFQIILREKSSDRESLYAKGLIAFEYEKLISKVGRVLNLSDQTEYFWKAYNLAQERFGTYSFHSNPLQLSRRYLIFLRRSRI
jgi:hypothetical protein